MEKTLNEMITSDRGAAITIAVAFVATQAALLGFLPMAVGAIGLGLLAGTAVGKGLIEEKVERNFNKVTEREIVPYEEWPSECYICNTDIEKDMQVRGQFVVHKGESTANTKAVPLCEECTWTYTTLVDNHDRIVEIYDGREEPVEL